MSQILARATQLEWERVAEQGHASEGRQAQRNVWAVEALKPILAEEEYAAGWRAVRDCAAAFDGMRRAFDSERVQCSRGDFGMAARVSAVRCLEGLRQAALHRTQIARAPHCVEWIVQMHTLSDIARALGHRRRVGRERAPVPDTRVTRPFVRLVLMGMADHYAHCDAELETWRAL